MPKVHRIVLTGGPCGGKTTALAQIANRLESLGRHVLLVPEVPTILITAGVDFRCMTPERLLRCESALLGLQMSLEDSFAHIAQTMDRDVVLLMDRGTMDVSAYLPPELWQALMDENGWTTVGLRDRRYDAVIHLVTAALGAEAFYTTANNAARKEMPDEARAIDLRLQQAWVGHPHLRAIDNSTDFAGKMRRVLQSVCAAVGAPEPVEIERKFLVRSAPTTDWPVRAETSEIEQHYLRSKEGETSRVRKRGAHGCFAYTHTIKRPLCAGQRVEVERPVSAREYVALLADVDPSRRPIRKTRTCFLWNHQYFELDTFVEPRAGLRVLEVEFDCPDGPLTLPPFVEVDREVTGDPAYSNYALSRRE